MTDPVGGRSSAWLLRRSTLSALVAVVGLAGLALTLFATRDPVSGQSSVINARAEQEVPVSVALAKPEPKLPQGMPTAKPKKLGAPLDPLSGSEVGYARGLALKAAGESTGKRVDGTPGLQFLSINLTENDGSEPVRSATVNSYDYATDELVTQTVDLESGKVDTARAKGVQPPPSKREVDTAMTRLLADPASQALKDDYKGYTGVALTSPDQLDYAGGAWVADDESDGAEKCGQHRCVFFQIRTEDGRGLVMVDQIVDLSANTIEAVKP